MNLLSFMSKLLDITNQEVSGACPWIADLSTKEALHYLQEEIKELEDGLNKGDSSEVKEEMGDVLRNVIILFFVVCKEYAIQPEEVLQGIIKKMKWRKPYLFSGEKVSKEDAVKIWFEQKDKEKR